MFRESSVLFSDLFGRVSIIRRNYFLPRTRKQIIIIFVCVRSLINSPYRNILLIETGCRSMPPMWVWMACAGTNISAHYHRPKDLFRWCQPFKLVDFICTLHWRGRNYFWSCAMPRNISCIYIRRNLRCSLSPFASQHGDSTIHGQYVSGILLTNHNN